jgi:hypothetical protein
MCRVLCVLQFCIFNLLVHFVPWFKQAVQASGSSRFKQQAQARKKMVGLPRARGIFNFNFCGEEAT